MNTLADTSIWIHHLRAGGDFLSDLLAEGAVLMHPFVAGELACGNLADCGTILADLKALPAAVQATDTEVMNLIESRKLSGRGLGWVDMHLLASALLSGCTLVTLDRKLKIAAAEITGGFNPSLNRNRDPDRAAVDA